MERERIDIILDRCLDDVRLGKKSVKECLRAYPVLNEEDVSLLEVVEKLKAGSSLSASSEFHSGAEIRIKNLILSKSNPPSNPASEETIYERIKRTLFGAGDYSRGLTHRKRFSFAALLAVIIFSMLLVSSGVVIASAKALPGDIFYPIKLSLETTRLSISQSESDDGLLHLEFASRRLNEIDQLLALRRTAEVNQALNLYARQVSASLEILLEGKNLTETQRVILAHEYEKLLSLNVDRLNDLLTKVPSDLQEVVIFALAYSKNSVLSSQDILSRTQSIVDKQAEPDPVQIVPGASQISTESPAETAIPTPTMQPLGIPDNSATKPSNFRETAVDWWANDPVAGLFFRDLYWPEEWFDDEDFEWFENWPEEWPKPGNWSDLRSTIEPTLEYLGTKFPVDETPDPSDLIQTVFPTIPPRP